MSIRDHDELTRILESKRGRHFLAALPLLASEFQSTALLSVLRSEATPIVVDAERRFDARITLAAFGSLGRLEFVRDESDLDPLIVVEPRGSHPPDPNDVRGAILTPLALHNPWLSIDHRDAVVANRWNEMKPDLPFPVVFKHELLDPGEDRLLRQRRWQFLLESRPLAGRPLFTEIYRQCVPRETREDHNGDDTAAPERIDFYALYKGISAYLPAFEDPMHLYKSHFKCWKTIYLREFYTFGVTLMLVLGYYQQAQRRGELQINDQFLRGSVLLRLARALLFVDVTDEQCATDGQLESDNTEHIRQALAEEGILERELHYYQAGCSSGAGKLLQGLLMTLLARYTACRDQLLEPQVRRVLSDLDSKKFIVNPLARFQETWPDDTTRNVQTELQRLHESYMKYMRATARSLMAMFPNGRLWTGDVDPEWLARCLEKWAVPVGG